ncbi:MAG: hypothetical protein ACKO7G_10495, partial [Gammaproteobacteria bacterium]
RPDGEVTVYLPTGEWAWLDTGEPIAGGRCHRLHLPLERIPVFKRAGARLP